MYKNLYAAFAVVCILCLLLPNAACLKITLKPTSGSQGATGEIPVVTPQNVKPYIADFPGKTSEGIASNGGGLKISNNGMTLAVPQGAVKTDTKLVVKEFTDDPPFSQINTGAGQKVFRPIGKAYDFGPDGTSFDKPVEVTLPYDGTLLTDSVDPSRIGIAYYDGEKWVVVGGQVDTQKHTVTARFTAFHGVAEWIIYLILGSIITGTGVVISHKNPNTDPPGKNKANDYIIPDKPVVDKFTKMAGYNIKKNGKWNWTPLEDPNNPGKFNPDIIEALKEKPDNFSQGKPVVIFSNDRGKSEDIKVNYQIKDGKGNDLNWRDTEEFFKDNLTGECSSIANAYCSMFRHLGIEAWAVDGDLISEEGTNRHNWVEFFYNGKAYFYDNNVGIVELEKVEKNLIRPEGLGAEGWMWNKEEQKRYKKEWWKYIVQSLSIEPATLTGVAGKQYTFTAKLKGAPQNAYYLWQQDGKELAGNEGSIKTSFADKGKHTLSVSVLESPPSVPLRPKELGSAQAEITITSCVSIQPATLTAPVGVYQFTATADPSVSNPTYIWDISGSPQPPTASNTFGVNFNSPGSGTVGVTLFDGSNQLCSATAKVVITQPATPTITIPTTTPAPTSTPTTAPPASMGWNLQSVTPAVGWVKTNDACYFNNKFNLSAGSGSASQSWTGKNCVEGDTCSGSRTGQVSWSAPPSTLLPNINYPMSVSISASASQTCGSRGQGNRMSLYIGGSKAGEASCEGDSNNLPPAQTKTLTFSVSPGSNGATLDIYVNYNTFAGRGDCTYHYVWGAASVPPLLR